MEDVLIHVVDDEEDLLEVYQTLLEDRYRVKAFTSPKDFLENLKQEMPALVITDFNMPEMTGIEMIRKGFENSNRPFPFIVLSGYLDKDNAVAAVNLGVFRLLEKPTDGELLLATIDQLLVEYQVTKVQTEAREITSQLKELYSSIRVILSQYIPDEILERLMVETDENGQVKARHSFEEFLERLESRLDFLLKSERVLLELKTQNYKQ
jgi:FixJ family two-component response regulator